jgi:hypothetical protein
MHTGDYVTIKRAGKPFIFRLVGTRGVLEFWAWESAYHLTNASHPHGQLFTVERYRQSGHQRYLESLAEQIDAGRADYAIPASSLTALELCEGAYISSAHRCRVTLPLADFAIPTDPDWRPGQPYSGAGGGRDGRKLA